MFHRIRIPLCVVACVLLGSVSAALAEEAAAFKQENKPENLKALLQQVHQLIHVKKDLKAAAALFAGTVPDEDRAKAGMKDDVAAETKTKILAMHQGLRTAMASKPEGIATLCKAEQTDVQVHGATTEEIIKYEKGSVAYNEFPGGARRVAELVLRPKTTYYEVEFLVPGQDAGMKFHLFYWDGKQWSAIGPVWRLLPAPAPAPAK